tara:strand:- start:275 stop:601 length:327 start_codon:yes stop_codon:yes gene_type:complete
MKIRFIFLITIIFLYLSGCQSIKDGLEGKKKSNKAEEFLIKKKNPLVLPPDFTELPTPIDKSQKDIEEDEFDLKKILNTNKSMTLKTNKKSEANISLKKKILKKINEK